MTLSWEELSALIDETLAAGEPEAPIMPLDTVDNDGNVQRDEATRAYLERLAEPIVTPQWRPRSDHNRSISFAVTLDAIPKAILCVQTIALPDTQWEPHTSVDGIVEQYTRTYRCVRYLGHGDHHESIEGVRWDDVRPYPHFIEPCELRR